MIIIAVGGASCAPAGEKAARAAAAKQAANDFETSGMRPLECGGQADSAARIADPEALRYRLPAGAAAKLKPWPCGEIGLAVRRRGG
jgi:hypothetical protein